jgi:hypothetical protein
MSQGNTPITPLLARLKRNNSNKFGRESGFRSEDYQKGQIIEIKPRVSGKGKLTKLLDLSSKSIKCLMTRGYEEGLKSLDKRDPASGHQKA